MEMLQIASKHNLIINAEHRMLTNRLKFEFYSFQFEISSSIVGSTYYKKNVTVLVFSF